MRHFLLALMLPLAACTALPIGGTLPGTQVCAAIEGNTFDTALRAYNAAEDAVNLLVDAHVLTPGTPAALAVANANDRVLAAFAVAEHARVACNSDSYAAALAEAQAAIADLRVALHK